MIKISKPYEFLFHLKSLPNLTIYTTNDPISICSLKIFTLVLTKEFIKHEIIFTDVQEYSLPYIHLDKQQELCIKTSNCTDKENMSIDTLITFKLVDCKCLDTKFNLILNLYKLVKGLNMVDEEIIWPMVIVFSFYKMYLYNSETSQFSDKICAECIDLFNEISIEINNKTYTDGIFYKYGLVYPLIRYSSLYNSLKCDMHFVVKNKLIYQKKKDAEEYKICTFLARKGISIIKAKEYFCNLDHSTTKYFTNTLTVQTQFYKKIGHFIKMSAIDTFFLLSCFLLQNDTLSAFLFLDKIFSTVEQIQLDYFFNVFKSIRDSLAKVSRIDKLLIFNLKNDKVKNQIYYINLAYSLINIYRRDGCKEYDFIVVIDKLNEKSILVCDTEGHRVYSKKEYYDRIYKGRR